ncbi:MAG TPA: hypothetical protein VNN80_22085, partial [Polyangiaceae bacterium]|nr:hypothetical protein [Polyangiaceae bacterium]
MRQVQLAVRQARPRTTPALDPSIFEFIENALLVREMPGDPDRSDCEAFALRFQQFTGPVMAKAVEDTALYRYHRLIALNEIGGDPASFGISLERFHAQYAERLRSWPLSMVTTSTHHTKRGEDVAASLVVLTEMPDEWRDAVLEWARLAAKYKSASSEPAAPSRRDEYMYWQALVGAWPFGWDGVAGLSEFTERLKAFMQKATREAKELTSWVSRDSAYEASVAHFVQGTLADDELRAKVAAFCQRIGTYGATNAIAKLLLRLCSPGVPDTYQGSELWTQSLVEPDNRRGVDYDRRRALLDEITNAPERAALIERLLAGWTDGALKLFVTRVALETRSEWRDVFVHGDYAALPAGEHVIAFIRTTSQCSVIVCVPRLTRLLTRGEHRWPLGRGVWSDQTLLVPAGEYTDAFTQRELATHGTMHLADIFATFPLALLISSSAPPDC